MNRLTKIAIASCLSLPLLVSADARYEVDTDSCHAPWDQNDADNEYKGDCSGAGLQLDGTGNYNATAFGYLYGVKREMIEAPISDTGKPQSTETNCETTAGTFQDDDGNEYTTNDCSVVITYKRKGSSRGNSWNIDYRIELWNAALTSNKARGDAPVRSGVSRAAR